MQNLINYFLIKQHKKYNNSMVYAVKAVYLI